jgi:hypothetical protein
MRKADLNEDERYLLAEFAEADADALRKARP